MHIQGAPESIFAFVSIKIVSVFVRRMYINMKIFEWSFFFFLENFANNSEIVSGNWMLMEVVVAFGLRRIHIKEVTCYSHCGRHPHRLCTWLLSGHKLLSPFGWLRNKFLVQCLSLSTTCCFNDRTWYIRSLGLSGLILVITFYLWIKLPLLSLLFKVVRFKLCSICR